MLLKSFVLKMPKGKNISYTLTHTCKHINFSKLKHVQIQEEQEQEEEQQQQEQQLLAFLDKFAS